VGEIKSIKVDEELTAFVRKQVDDGRYASESEFVEEAHACSRRARNRPSRRSAPR
jgi:Arc/MetJ-type ribon-helix-helix transcriptional regulator